MKGMLLCRDPNTPPGSELLQDGVDEAMGKAAPAAAIEGGEVPAGESGGRADGAAVGAEVEEGQHRRGAAARRPRRHGRRPHRRARLRRGRRGLLGSATPGVGFLAIRSLPRVEGEDATE